MPAPLSRRARHSPQRPGRRERKRAETRERIFRAALALFVERGFAATTVEDITEAADVGKGTFFNYFPSKEHVLAAFPEMQVGKLKGVVAGLRETRQSIREVMRSLVHKLAEEPGRSPALVRAILGANLSSAPVRALVLGHMKRGWAALGEMYALGQRRGEVRRDVTPLQLAQATHQMFFGTLLLWAIEPSETLRDRLEHAFELFWPGIRAAGARGKE